MYAFVYATQLCFIKDLWGYGLHLKHTDCTTLPSTEADTILRPRGGSEDENIHVSHIKPQSLICLVHLKMTTMEK